MPLTNELKAGYELVLRDLEAQRQQALQQVSGLQARLKELHNSILTLSKCLDPDATPSRPLNVSHPPNEKYTTMSVRWAILDLLKDSNPMATAEIAEALRVGGIKTKAANFANNVSSVLSSTMEKSPHNEVQQIGGKWELTESGKRAIEHIRTTPKFRGAVRGRFGIGARF
jgi:hypothetical protein